MATLVPHPSPKDRKENFVEIRDVQRLHALQAEWRKRQMFLRGTLQSLQILCVEDGDIYLFH